MSATVKEDLSKPVETVTRNRAIGAILVDAGRLTERDVSEIQAFADQNGMLFGAAGIALKKVKAEDLDLALGRQFHYPTLPCGRGGLVTSDVVTAHQPQSAVAEDFRTIRSRLVIDWLNHAERNILAIVSPRPGDGRSWFAANLATAFAQAGERTLLIDADMRRPRQHELFKINDSLGLAALLTGRAGTEAAHRIHPELRLCVMPAGVLPPNPQELLTRPAFEVALTKFAGQFDVVIIDTPPGQASADAQVIAARAGSALVLARRDHTTELALQETAKALLDSRVKVVGCVINEYV
jgi:chain length determinant protein tyrosine kinase EpsG